MLLCLLLIAAEPRVPQFTLHTAAGKDVRGPLQTLKDDWSVRIGTTEPVDVPGADLLSVRQAGVALPPVPDGLHVILANGDRIPVQAPRLVDERLHFTYPDLEGGRDVSVPLAAVSVLWRVAPDRADDAVALRHRLATETRTRDIVLLRNGDVLAGVLNALNGDEVVLEVEKRSVKAPFNQVAAVALSTELAEKLQPKGVWGRFVGTSGARLSLTSVTCGDGGPLEGRTVFGARLRVPLDRVAALDLEGGRGVYLSDLKPSQYEYLPYLDERWTLTRDVNAAGHDLRLGGSTYTRGIGLHSHSRVSYRLDGGYRRFECLVGLDDSDGAEGSVHIRVLADGKELDSAGRNLKPADGAVPISVSVEGVKELTLVVEFGRGGNVQDVVNWVDARLVR
jgi:hypothetical protein